MIDHLPHGLTERRVDQERLETLIMLLAMGLLLATIVFSSAHAVLAQSRNQQTISTSTSSNANKFATYTNSSLGIEVKYPSDWSLEDCVIGCIITLNSPDVGQSGSFIIGIEDCPPPQPSCLGPAQYLNNVTNMDQNDTNFYHNFQLVHSDANSVLAGKPAYKLEFTYTNNQGTSKDVTEIGTIIDSKVYWIQEVTDVGRASNYLPAFQQMKDSFQIKQSAGISATADNASTLDNKGVNLFQLGKYNDSITYFDKALAINPNDEKALSNKGTALAIQGKYNDSITYFDKALAINPNDEKALSNKGLSLLNLGKYNDSITYFDKALAINPNDQNILSGKAAAFAALNKSR